jgi:hypothetical protein
MPRRTPSKLPIISLTGELNERFVLVTCESSSDSRRQEYSSMQFSRVGTSTGTRGDKQRPACYPAAVCSALRASFQIAR